MPKRELTEIELQNNQLKRKTNAFLNSVREFLKKKTGGDSVPPEWECSLMLLEEYYKQFTKLSMEIEKLDRLVVQSRYGEVPNPLLAARDKSAVRLESLMKNLGITFKEAAKLELIEPVSEESPLEVFIKNKMGVEKR
jgi:hypothetical protein